MRNMAFETDKTARPIGQMQHAQSEQMARMSEAWIKAAARAGNETSGLVGRRVRAYAEIPSRLGLCKSPTDLQAEQMRFWQNCAQDYAQATRAVVEAWSAVMPMASLGSQGGLPGLNPMLPAFWMHGLGEATPRDERPERDTLTMPEREARPARTPQTSTAYDLPQQGIRRPAA